MTTNDLAYFAGLFDGEGCVYISFSKPRTYKLVAAVEMTVPFAVVALQQAFGGEIYTHKRANNKTAFKWHLYSKQAYEFLRTIGPYCRVKCAEVSYALQYYDTSPHAVSGKKLEITEIARRKWYYNRLKELKKREFVYDDLGKVIEELPTPD